MVLAKTDLYIKIPHCLHVLLERVHIISKKHYIPESTFIYQKALRKHMQGGLYALWITILCMLDN